MAKPTNLTIKKIKNDNLYFFMFKLNKICNFFTIKVKIRVRTQKAKIDIKSDFGLINKKLF